jgi:SpoVK/Ycf46/Vps4 family AAA+-type ATPase
MNIITTHKEWDDVLPAADVKTLVNVLDAFRQGTVSPVTNKGQRPSCSIFFYGGDSEKRKIAAALAGVHTGLPVYRIDLPAIVSKYIGETEKNIAAVFNKAAGKNWILFFDEADDLFNKRTGMENDNNKYASQETDYLLQQIEKYKNPVIIAADYKQQVASSVLRSFHTVIHFPDK